MLLGPQHFMLASRAGPQASAGEGETQVPSDLCIHGVKNQMNNQTRVNHDPTTTTTTTRIPKFQDSWLTFHPTAVLMQQYDPSQSSVYDEFKKQEPLDGIIVGDGGVRVRYRERPTLIYDMDYLDLDDLSQRRLDMFRFDIHYDSLSEYRGLAKWLRSAPKAEKVLDTVLEATDGFSNAFVGGYTQLNGCKWPFSGVSGDNRAGVHLQHLMLHDQVSHISVLSALAGVHYRDFSLAVHHYKATHQDWSPPFVTALHAAFHEQNCKPPLEYVDVQDDEPPTPQTSPIEHFKLDLRPLRWWLKCAPRVKKPKEPLEPDVKLGVRRKAYYNLPEEHCNEKYLRQKCRRKERRAEFARQFKWIPGQPQMRRAEKLRAKEKRRRAEAAAQKRDSAQTQSGKSRAKPAARKYGFAQTQSGEPTKRQIRDALQRAAAQAAKEAKRKSVPKEARKNYVTSQKMTKQDAKVFTQSASYIAAAGVVGVAALGATKIVELVRDALGEFTTTSRLWSARMDGFVSATSRTFKPIKDMIINVEKHLRKVFGNHLWVLPLVVVVYYCVKYLTPEHKDHIPLLLTLLASVVGSHMWDSVSHYFEADAVEFQADIGNFAKMFACAMAFAVFGTKGRDHIGEFSKRLGGLERCSSGLEAMLEWSLMAIQNVINWLGSKYNWGHVQLVRQKNAEIIEWSNEVDRLHTSHVTASAKLSPELANTYISAYRNGKIFAELYRSDRDVSQHLAHQLAKLNNMIRPLVGAINARKNFRQEPVFVLLYGKPGIGKTVVTQYMATTIMAHSGMLGERPTEDELRSHMWQKGGGDYWNGYSGQKCLIMDDAFQSRVTTSDKENDYITLIHAIGSWSCPLNMADVESKGGIYFDSELIFGSTNAESVLSEAEKVIASPQAFIRRIGYGYELCLKKEFMTTEGYLDMQKYREELAKCAEKVGFAGYPFYMWYFRKHNFGTGVTDTQIVPVLDVMAKIVHDIKNRGIAQKEFELGLSSYLKRTVQTECGSIDIKEWIKPSRPKTLADLFKQRLSDTVDKYSVVKRLLKLAIIGGGCYVAWKLIVASFTALKKMFGSVESQSNRPAGHPMKIRASKITAQSGEEVANKAYCNTFKVVVDCEKSSTVLGQLMMLNDCMGVVPAHFFAAVANGLEEGKYATSDKVIFTNAGNRSHRFEMTLAHFLAMERHEMKQYDLSFIKLKTARACKNITKMFTKESDIRHLGGCAGRIDHCELINGALPDPDRRLAHSFPSMSVGANLIAYTGQDKNVMIRHLRYRAATRPGDCGAPVTLIGNNSFQNRNLVGIHVAGLQSVTEGYAAIITQELIEEARKALSVIDDQFIDDVQVQSGVKMDITEDLPFAEPGSFLPIGIMEKPVVICPVSSYYKTWAHGIFGEYDCLPAVMSPRVVDGVVVYPLERALLPYATDLRFYEQPWLNQVAHTALSRHSHLTRDYGRELYTFDEAVLGIPEMKFRSIPRGTSPGFPFVYYHRNGKTDFFGYGDKYDLDNKNCDSLRERVNYIIAAAKDGIRLSHVFVDFPKDELRDKKKIEAIATRLISASPLDYTIVWRMYFGAFGSATMKNHTSTGMAPGICTYSEWEKVVAMVTRYGGKVFAGDFKSFDSSEQPDILNLFLAYVNDWYNDGPENKRVREVLWADLVHSRHIGGLGKDQRFVYQWAKSLPSGHPFTTIVNSMYSLFCMVASYSVATGDFIGFWNKCASVVYGDDNLTGADDDTIEVFNQVSTAAILKREFGLTYTSDLKDGELEAYTTLDRVTLLKRGFVREGSRWLCPLALKSFLYTIYWGKNKRLESTIICDVLESGLEELSMHEQSVWDIYAPQFAAALGRYDKVPKGHLSRMSYQDIVMSKTDSWF